MSEEFKVEIVNPEKSFLVKEDVSEVVVPAFEGEMGILKDHISIISFLKPGIIKVITGNEEHKFYIEDGILEFKDNTLSILTSNIFNIKEKDVEFATILNNKYLSSEDRINKIEILFKKILSFFSLIVCQVNLE